MYCIVLCVVLSLDHVTRVTSTIITITSEELQLDNMIIRNYILTFCLAAISCMATRAVQISEPDQRGTEVQLIADESMEVEQAIQIMHTMYLI